MTKTSSKILVSYLLAGVLSGIGSLAQVSSAQAAAPVGAASAADAVPAALSDLRADHVSISVQDIDREEAWYALLGFKEFKRRTLASMENRNLHNANFRIDLIKYTGSARTPADPVYLQQGYVHLALTVPDIAAARAALIAEKVEVNGSGNIAVRDPEGNEIEISARQ